MEKELQCCQVGGEPAKLADSDKVVGKNTVEAGWRVLGLGSRGNVAYDLATQRSTSNEPLAAAV